MHNLFFFPPVFGTGYRLHAYNGICVSFYTRIFCSGYMVDKEVVVTSLKVEMCGETFLPVKQFLAVSKISSDTHIGASGECETEITHGSEKVVERYALMQPTSAAFVAAVSQDNLCA